MGLRGRYFSQRDLNLVGQFNAELMGDIIENIIMMFKISPNQTAINQYGEASATTGKVYNPGIELSVLVERPEMTTDHDEFGPTRSQDHIFKFREKMLEQLNFYPEIGDVIFWNDRYYEINNVVQEQLLGGVTEKNHSIICNGHYTRITNLNIAKIN